MSNFDKQLVVGHSLTDYTVLYPRSIYAYISSITDFPVELLPLVHCHFS